MGEEKKWDEQKKKKKKKELLEPPACDHGLGGFGKWSECLIRAGPNGGFDKWSVRPIRSFSWVRVSPSAYSYINVFSCKKNHRRKARELEFGYIRATFDEHRRAVGMLMNPVRDKNESTYGGGGRGREGLTPVTTTVCPEHR